MQSRAEKAEYQTFAEPIVKPKASADLIRLISSIDQNGELHIEQDKPPVGVYLQKSIRSTASHGEVQHANERSDKIFWSGCWRRSKNAQLAPLFLIVMVLIAVLFRDNTGSAGKTPQFRAAQYLAKAKKHSHLHEYAAVISNCDEGIKLRPTPDLFFLRGVAYGELGRYDNAMADLDRALKVGFPKANRFWIRGKMHESIAANLREQQYEKFLHETNKAITDFSKAIELDNTKGEFYESRADLLYDLSDYPKAIENYTAALDLNGSDKGYCFFKRGEAHGRLGDHQKALADFTKSIEINRMNAGTFVNRATSFRCLGRYEEALEDLSRAITIRPDNAISYLSAAQLLFRLGRHEEAREDFTKAISLSPGDVEAYAGRALCFAKMGQDIKALQDAIKCCSLSTSKAESDELNEYSEEICLDAHCSEAYLRRAEAFEEQQDYQSAIDDYSSSLELDSSSFLAAANRAQDEELLGRHGAAIADCKQALRMSPSGDPLLFLTLGTAFSNLNQHHLAIEHFSNAIALDPSFAEAYVKRGIAREAIQQHNAAMNDYRLCANLVLPTDVWPGDPESFAYCYRSFAHARIGDREKSFNDLEKAVVVASQCGRYFGGHFDQLTEPFYIDKTGQIKQQCQQPALDYRNFAGKLRVVQVENGYGFKDTNGAVILPPRFFPKESDLNNFGRGISLSNPVDAADFNGHFSPSLSTSCSGKLIPVLIGMKYGFKNQGGKVVIEPRFDCAGAFSEGLGAVCIGGKWGYINENGIFVINPFFDSAEPFQKGRALVSVNCVGTKEYEHGNKFMATGDLRKALRYFSVALKHMPHPAIYCARSRSYQGLSLHKQAIDDCTKAVNLAPEAVEAYVVRAKSFEKIRLFDEAIADYQQAIELVRRQPDKVKELADLRRQFAKVRLNSLRRE